MKNRVWIELEHPGDDHSLGYARAKLANQMLERLHNTPPTNSFWWNADKFTYCFGGDSGFTECGDNGQWFSLDFLGRDNQQETEQ